MSVPLALPTPTPTLKYSDLELTKCKACELPMQVRDKQYCSYFCQFQQYNNNQWHGIDPNKLSSVDKFDWEVHTNSKETGSTTEKWVAETLAALSDEELTDILVSNDDEQIFLRRQIDIFVRTQLFHDKKKHLRCALCFGTHGKKMAKSHIMDKARMKLFKECLGDDSQIVKFVGSEQGHVRVTVTRISIGNKLIASHRDVATALHQL